MHLATVAFGMQLGSQLGLYVLMAKALDIPSHQTRRMLVGGILIIYLISFGGQLAAAIGHGHLALAIACLVGRAAAEALALVLHRTGHTPTWLELRILQVMTWIPTGALYAPFTLGLGAS